MQYRTKDGDVLDAICVKHYGDAAPVATVLAANPGLAAHGAVLPAGVMIDLPPIARDAPERPVIRLWS